MARDDGQRAQALQLGGLDIGRLHHVQDRRPRHPHHVRQHHEHQHHHRQGDGIQLVTQAHPVIDRRDRRKDAELHRQEVHQQIADHELGQRNRGKRHPRYQPVRPAVAIAHRQKAQRNRQRHRDDCRPEREEQRVAQTAADFGGDVLAVRQRHAQIAVQDAPQPQEIPGQRGLIQTQFLAQVGKRFRRGRLPQDRLRHVARQQLDPDEDQRRHRQQQDKADPKPLRHQFDDRMHVSPPPSGAGRVGQGGPRLVLSSSCPPSGLRFGPCCKAFGTSARRRGQAYTSPGKIKCHLFESHAGA